MEVTISVGDAELEKLILSAVHGKKRPDRMLGDIVLSAVGARVEQLVTDHMSKKGFDKRVTKRVDEMLDKCVAALVDGYCQYRLRSMVEIEGNAKMLIAGEVVGGPNVEANRAPVLRPDEATARRGRSG